jgi:hypothetical protein
MPPAEVENCHSFCLAPGLFLARYTMTRTLVVAQRGKLKSRLTATWEGAISPQTRPQH